MSLEHFKGLIGKWDRDVCKIFWSHFPPIITLMRRVQKLQPRGNVYRPIKYHFKSMFLSICHSFQDISYNLHQRKTHNCWPIKGNNFNKDLSYNHSFQDTCNIWKKKTTTKKNIIFGLSRAMILIRTYNFNPNFLDSRGKYVLCVTHYSSWIHLRI